MSASKVVAAHGHEAVRARRWRVAALGRRLRDRAGALVAAALVCVGSSRVGWSAERAPAPARADASSGEGLGVGERDALFALRFSAILAARAGVSKPVAEPLTPFAAAHLARLIARGHTLDPRLRYLVSVELTRAPYLRDLELSWAWRPELVLRVGQFRVPFSRQFLVPRSSLQLTDRSIVSDHFRVGRSQGVAWDGQLWGGRYTQQIGLFDGAGAGWAAGTLLAVARLTLAPYGALAYDETSARAPGPLRIALGLSGHSTFDRPAAIARHAPRAEQGRSVVGVDVALRAGPLGLAAEGYVARRRAVDGRRPWEVGGFVQFGVFVLPGRVELAARASGIYEPLSSPRAPRVGRIELGATHHWARAGAKLQLVYGFTDSVRMDADAASRAGHHVHAQATLAF